MRAGVGGSQTFWNREEPDDHKGILVRSPHMILHVPN